MANPYLASDESVILATDRVIFRSVPLSALVLTNKRLLLLTGEGATLAADEIPLARIRAATADLQAAKEPGFALIYDPGTGAARHEVLAFTEREGRSRIRECREWAETISGQIAPLPAEGTIIRIPPVSREPGVRPAEEPPEPARSPAPAPGSEPAGGGDEIPASVSQGWILAKHERPSGLAFPAKIPVPEPDLAGPAAPSPGSRIVRLAVLIIVVLAVLAIALAVIQEIPGRPAAAPPAPAPAAPAATTAATPAPTPLPAATPSAGPTPAPAVPIPPDGVWVVVEYDGTFAGSVGVGGDLTDVAAAGSRYYRIPTRTGTVKAIIQKTEGSADLLTVSVYQDGMLVERGSTDIPLGEVNIQADLRKLAAVPAETVTAAAAEGAA